MTSFEIKSTLGIAFIYILRMLGLFIVLPIMSLHLNDLSEYSSTFMIGLTFGIYWLTQALFQIPFGILSDKFGRKRMILLGLFIFLLGSVFIYFSQSLIMIIIGRGLQGAGAISAVLLALLADLTTDSSRTKSMAIIGASIGLTFGVSIVLSPILNSYLGFENIFLMIAILTVIAMGVLIKYIPSPINLAKNKDNKNSFKQVIFDKVFLKLDLGIFSLHASPNPLTSLMGPSTTIPLHPRLEASVVNRLPATALVEPPVFTTRTSPVESSVRAQSTARKSFGL